MNDTLLMSRLHPFSNLTADLQGFFNRQRPLGNTFSQGFAFHQLQRQKMHTLCLFKSIDGSDVGVIELGQQLGFPLKPGQSLGVPGELLGQHLDGHFTVEVGVLGPVDLTHTAFTDFLQNFVMTDACPDQDAPMQTVRIGVKSRALQGVKATGIL